MKVYLGVMFLLFSLKISCSPAFYLSVNSFLGGYLYPDRDDKEMSYFEKQDIRFGLKNLTADNFTLELMLQTAERLQENRLNLYSLNLKHQRYDNWHLEFLIDQVGYGMRDEYFDLDPTDPNYRKHRLGDYRFTGILFYNNLPGYFAWTQKIGGNHHNTSLGTTSVFYDTGSLMFGFFYLFTGRDNNFNKTMHSLGSEFRYEKGLLRLYHAQTWQHLSSTYTRTNYLTYGELYTNISQIIGTGCNIFYAESYRGYSDWLDLSLLARYEVKKIHQTFMYSYEKAEDLRRSNIGTIIEYLIAQNFSVGINSRLYFSQTGDKYYRIGLQVRINEKFPF